MLLVLLVHQAVLATYIVLLARDVLSGAAV